MNWRLSGGFLRQDGVIQGTTTERLSLGANFQQLLFEDRLDIRVFQRGSRTFDRFTPGGVLSNAAQMGPTQPVSDANTTTGYYDWPGNTLQSPDNPLAILDLATDHGTTYRSIGSLQSAYRLPFVDGLRAHMNVNYDLARADRQTFTPSALHSQKKIGHGWRRFPCEPEPVNTGLETLRAITRARSTCCPAPSMDLTGGYSYQQSHAEYHHRTSPRD